MSINKKMLVIFIIILVSKLIIIVGEELDVYQDELRNEIQKLELCS